MKRTILLIILLTLAVAPGLRAQDSSPPLFEETAGAAQTDALSFALVGTAAAQETGYGATATYQEEPKEERRMSRRSVQALIGGIFLLLWLIWKGLKGILAMIGGIFGAASKTLAPVASVPIDTRSRKRAAAGDRRIRPDPVPVYASAGRADMNTDVAEVWTREAAAPGNRNARLAIEPLEQEVQPARGFGGRTRPGADAARRPTAARTGSLLDETREAAEAGDVSAQYNMGVMLKGGVGVTRSASDAVKWFRKAAVQNDPQAAFTLAEMYHTGDGVVRDDAGAMKWYIDAAERGHPGAQFALGRVFLAGDGVVRDEPRAVDWLRRAAEQGHPGAQYALGVIYGRGEGVGGEKVEEASWYRAAAARGNADAQNNLGWMYLTGEGVAREPAEAEHWFRQAAEQEHPAAEFNLGMMYDSGDGVLRDKAEARKWFKLAAAQGYPAARRKLNGVGGEPGEGAGAMSPRRRANPPGDSADMVEAASWFRKAAEQEYPAAQFSLGVLYCRGEGVARDDAEAEKWLRKAAAQGHAMADAALKVLDETRRR
ncbi:MAG: SEL1-like repeat protein [Methylobacteriaceae bacterium]|jgi:TPR repeat protein|nr:SEL1-like repeat protein [Methylobacteriaceae bacterium]